MSGDLSGFSLLELFRMEAESNTATLLTGLVALEGALASPEVIEPLMRAAHSLKGAARIVGLDVAVRVAHAMEDCFVAAQKGKLALRPGHVDILLRGVDMLVRVSQLAEADLESWQADHAAEIDALVADLAAVKEGRAEPPLAVEAPGKREAPPLALGVERREREAGSDLIHREVEAPTEPAARPSADRDRVVRVTAESLSRLMGLAGEALVQSHRLRPLVDSLWRLRGRHIGLLEDLQTLEHRLDGSGNANNKGTDPGDTRLRLSAVGQEWLAKAKARATEDLQSLGETVEAIEVFAASARTSPAGFTTRCSPAGCGRWPTASAASRDWSATWLGTWANRRGSRLPARPPESTATSSTGSRRPSTT